MNKMDEELIELKNHIKVNGQLLQTNKKWSHLKEKQKAWIMEVTKAEYHVFVKEYNKLPMEHKEEVILDKVLEKINERGIWIPDQEAKIHIYKAIDRRNRKNAMSGEAVKQGHDKKDTIEIVQVTESNLGEILELQYFAYQSEAKLLNNFDIPPLKETLDDLKEEYKQSVIFITFDKNKKLIGSVRGYIEDNTLFIGKLMVHPAYQNRGIGKQLLKYMETRYPGMRYELFTSDKSVKNLKIYEQSGYVQFKEEAITETLKFIYLEKNVHLTS